MHAGDLIGRTGRYAFGSEVKIKIPPWGVIKWCLHPKSSRVYHNVVKKHPTFRRASAEETGRGYRDACELRVEVLQDLGIQASFKPICMWVGDHVKLFGAKADR